MEKKRKYKYRYLIIYLLILAVFVFILRVWHYASARYATSYKYEYENIVKPQTDQWNYDVKHYDIYLKVYIDTTLTSGKLSGRVKILFSALTENLNTISLNLSSNMTVDSIPEAEQYTHIKNQIQLTIRKTLTKNDTGSVTIYYHGWPKQYHKWILGWKLAIHTNNKGKASPWITTVNPPFGAQTWFPCKDTPSDKVDSVNISVDVPDSLIVVSNGRLIKSHPTTDGRKIFFWKEKYPIATYLIAVNIGQFLKFERTYLSKNGFSINLQIYSFEPDSSMIDLIFKQLENMFNFFNNLLGPYPFRDEKYAMVPFSTDGGMENQTVSSVDQIDPSRENLYVHELVHQWLGNMITNETFHDSWINEGLATYFTGLYIKYNKGESAFRYYMNSHRYLRQGKMKVQFITHPDSVYHRGRVYDRSNWFFHMLHQFIGDEKFYQGIRYCLKKYAFGTVNENKLRKVFEEVSQLDLKRFFNQWIEKGDVPILKCKVEAQYPSEIPPKYIVYVKQITHGKEPYFLPVDFQFKSFSRDTIITLNVDQFENKFEVNLPFFADKIYVDPLQKLLVSTELIF